MSRSFLLLVRGLMVAVLLTLGLSVASAKDVATSGTYSAASPLESYIQSVCKKGCVDADLLTMAVHTAAEDTRLRDPLLMMAVIRVESRFQLKATNRVSGRSVGLTQVQVYWHKKDFRTTNHYDVMDNVRVGTGILKKCEQRWGGSPEKALWCYNGHQKRGMKTYVPAVMKAYRELKALGPLFTT